MFNNFIIYTSSEWWGINELGYRWILVNMCVLVVGSLCDGVGSYKVWYRTKYWHNIIPADDMYYLLIKIRKWFHGFTLMFLDFHHPCSCLIYHITIIHYNHVSHFFFGHLLDLSSHPRTCLGIYKYYLFLAKLSLSLFFILLSFSWTLCLMFYAFCWLWELNEVLISPLAISVWSKNIVRQRLIQTFTWVVLIINT